LLAVLAEDTDEKIRDRAGNALLSQPVSAFVEALAGDAPAPALFRYCGGQLLEKPDIALAIVRHRRCPPQVLPAAAKRLSASAVQELFANLDFLSSFPALVGTLAKFASLTADQREQLRELGRQDTEPQSAFAAASTDAEPNPEKRATLLQRLSKMRVVERVQLALKGNREERLALIRDPCKVVQRAVLQSPRLTDREVETFAAMANLSDEVLRAIAMNRAFARNPVVIRNLINNPKTPLDITLRWLPNLTVLELKSLMLNRNIPETLRTAAMRLQRQRSLERTGA
jgi:hypothetical protein